MATKTSLLGLTKPAYTEAADIAVLNTNFDLIDKAVGQGARVQNLLDNSWFGIPIAQAGRNGMHGSTKYVCDRWVSWDADATFANGCITPGSPIDQRIDPNMVSMDKTYTVAFCLSDGTIKAASGTLRNGAGSYNFGIHAIADASHVRVRLMTGFEIRWAALYEGTYTAETLPAYVYKGYAAELAECQRYYENSWCGGTAASVTRQFMGLNISAGQGDCYVQFMTPKAKVATINFYKAGSTSTESVWDIYRGHYYDVTVENLGRDGRNGFVIRFTKTDADPTTWAAWETVPLRGHWEASADL